MRGLERARPLLIGLIGVVTGALVVSPAIGEQGATIAAQKKALKKLVEKEVTKQLAGKTGPQGQQGVQGIQGSQGQQGGQGATGADGARVITRVVQTVEGLQSGDGAGNKTQMQLSGDTWVKDANEFLQFFPATPGVDPPETCTNLGGALNLEFRDAVLPFTLHTWVIPYTSMVGTGPQIPPPLEDFHLDVPTGEANVNIDVLAWDTCGGAGERWGIGGFGFVFRTTILGAV